MGLYKLCKHKGRARDRCDHAWWGSFQHQRKLHRLSLSKWSDEEIRAKAHAQVAFERMKQAVREGRLQKGEERDPEGPLTFARLAQLYAEKHARARASHSPRRSTTGSSRSSPFSALGGSPISRLPTSRISSPTYGSRAG